MSIMSKLVWAFSINPNLKKLKTLLPDAEVYPTGSRYICDPPRLGTDIDFLIYCKTDLDQRLFDAGYVKSEFNNYLGVPSADDFNAWRKGKVNLIVTRKRAFADTFTAATHWCKKRNLCVKIIRVSVHEMFRGNDVNLSEIYLPGNEADKSFLKSLIGPYGYVIVKAYRSAHGLDRSDDTR